ncbi:hypothetical protein D046_1864B, partial [Vibrio parahaemolyticus V-223/04]
TNSAELSSESDRCINQP